MPVQVGPTPPGPTNPATTDALTDRGYTGTGPEGQTRLDEAWRALRAEVPSLLTRMGCGEVETGTVVDIVAAAALRVLRNPEGHVEENNRLDDYSESWRRTDATQDMYFTAAELRRVAPPALPSAGSMKYYG